MRPLQEAVESIVEVVKAISERGRLSILSVDPSTGTLSVSASLGEPALPAGRSLRLEPGSGLARMLSEARELVIGVDDGALPEEVRSLSRSFGFRTSFLVPLTPLGRLVGWAVIDEPDSERAFGERERRLLSAAVRQASTLLENLELRDRVSSRQRTFEGIAHLGVVLTSTLRLDEAARQVVEYGSILTGLRAFILLYRPEGAAEFAVLAGEGVSERVTNCVLEPIEVAAIDLERIRVYTTADLRSITRSKLFDHCELEGFAYALVAPLSTEGGRLKGMLIGLDRRVLQLDEEQEVAFHLLVMQATNAVWNAERYEEQMRAQRELATQLARSTTLREAAVAATSSADVDEVARGVLEALREHLGHRAGDIRLLEADGVHLTLIAAFGYPEPTVRRIARARTDDPSLLALRAVREDRLLTHDDDVLSPERLAFLRGSGVLEERHASVPIRSRGAVLGTLTLVFEVRRPFAPEELALMQTVADVVGQAFENMRVYQAEHDLAETLQSSLLILPERVPGVVFEHLYHSAAEAARVGGDFYDVFELEHGRLGIVIGDVSGKGVDAAALTMVTRNAIRAYAYEGASPARTLAKVNEMVLRMSDPSSFVTALFGVLDPARRDLVYCAAGHPPGLVRRRDGRLEATASSSPFLGAFDSLEFVDESALLGSGDILFLYTDGVLEARRGDRELFGEERLFEALSGASTPVRAVTEVFERLTAFAGGELSDDVALLAVMPAPPPA